MGVFFYNLVEKLEISYNHEISKSSLTHVAVAYKKLTCPLRPNAGGGGPPRP